MIVSAIVKTRCWDSPTAQGFNVGQVLEGFDTESDIGKRLSSLVGARNQYVVQYPGHVHVQEQPRQSAPESIKAGRPKKVLSEEDRKAIGERLRAARLKKMSV